MDDIMSTLNQPKHELAMVQPHTIARRVLNKKTLFNNLIIN